MEQYKYLVDRIASELKPLTCCHVHKLYLTLRPAATLLCWNITPPTWARFFGECQKSLEEFQKFCVRLEDMRHNRIHSIMDSLTCFPLCPEDLEETLSLEEFTDVVRESCRKVAMEIQQRNLLLEASVNELAEMVWIPCKDTPRFFQIATEAIAVQVESTERLKPPAPSVHRKKKDSVTRQPAKTEDSAAAASAAAAALAADRRRGSLASTMMVDKFVKKLTKTGTGTSGSSTSCSLPHLNVPQAAPAAKVAVPSKSVSTTKLPRIVSGPSSMMNKLAERESCVSLPPLMASSMTSMTAASNNNSNSNSNQETAVFALPRNRDTLSTSDASEMMASSSSSSSSSSNSSSSSGGGEGEVNAVDYSMLVQQLEKAIHSWKRMYSKRILQLLTNWLRSLYIFIPALIYSSSFKNTIITTTTTTTKT